MTEKADNKVEALPDLDDLLQCPVCYEIPSGQIFQCNEGHHVCGRCKMRLDVCPVCRAFFFGTRNYAMEELIANVNRLQAFRLGGKVTTNSPPAEVAPEVAESSTEDNESTHENVIDEDNASIQTSTRVPTSCKGLFRCLCCKNNPERLPLGRLLNHLRYYHSPDLIEGRSENGGYLQAWQFPTRPGRLVTAVRVHDMGIFFLVIEITYENVHAWLSMAASIWAAHEFSYSFTLSGNDREAIFTDCVWSVRSCEGSLKHRGRCLCVSGADARALLTRDTMNGKLSVRPTPLLPPPQPRVLLRVANRGTGAPPPDLTHDLEPFLQDLQNDVARLSRAFATLGREANALVRSEAEMRARLENAPQDREMSIEGEASLRSGSPRSASPRPASPQPVAENGERQMSRSARRRMRQRLREAFRESQASEATSTTEAPRPAPRPAAAPRPATRPCAPPLLAAAPMLAAAPRAAAPRAATLRAATPRAATPRAAPPLLATAPMLAAVPRPATRPAAAPLLAAAARAPVYAPRPNPNRNAHEVTRPNVVQTGSIVNEPASNAIRAHINYARNSHGIRQPIRVGLADNATRVNGPNSNPGPRANSTQHSRAANEPVAHSIGYLRMVSPPPPRPDTPPAAFGGPSQNQPASGNTRNKKKLRKHR